MNDESITALAEQPDIYRRGGHLVEVLEIDGRRVIRELPLARIRERLAAAVEYIRLETDEETGELVEKPSHVPEWCVKAVACRGEWPEIPRLVGLLEAPALRPDGTVIQEPGLDRTGYLFMPGDDFPHVPESPTKGDALAARDALLEIVVDFPFATEAHRAAWLAFALTPFARPAFEGCTPIVAVDATTRGTGKGRLLDATANLALGHDLSKAGQPKDDDELRKRITAVLREGEPMHVIDNVSRRLEDASLDAVSTSTMWKDRALGKNETFSLPNLTTWVVNGNNLDFGADTARRTLHIRLESKLENPEDRDDFAHPDLLGWVRAERPRLVAAALTLLRAYMVTGKPAMGCKAWGSFEGWSRLLANAVVWVGMPDPQSTRVELEEASDTRKGALVALIDGWTRLCRDVPAGLTAKAALELLYSADRLRGQAVPDGFDDLREAIEALVPTVPGKQPSSQKLGAQLRHFRRRVIGGRMFDGEKGHAGFFRWRVVSEQASGAGEVGDDGESVPNPSYARPQNIPSSRSEGREGPDPPHPRHQPHQGEERDEDGWIDFGEEVA